MLLYIVLYQTVLLSESFEQLGGHDLFKNHSEETLATRRC